jgi:hypothetical protein
VRDNVLFDTIERNAVPPSHTNPGQAHDRWQTVAVIISGLVTIAVGAGLAMTGFNSIIETVGESNEETCVYRNEDEN